MWESLCCPISHVSSKISNFRHEDDFHHVHTHALVLHTLVLHTLVRFTRCCFTLCVCVCVCSHATSSSPRTHVVSAALGRCDVFPPHPAVCRPQGSRVLPDEAPHALVALGAAPVLVPNHLGDVESAVNGMVATIRHPFPPVLPVLPTGPVGPVGPVVPVFELLRAPPPSPPLDRAFCWNGGCE